MQQEGFRRHTSERVYHECAGVLSRFRRVVLQYLEYLEQNLPAYPNPLALDQIIDRLASRQMRSLSSKREQNALRSFVRGNKEDLRNALLGTEEERRVTSGRSPIEKRNKRLCRLQDLNDPIDDRRDGQVIEMAGSIENRVATGRKDSVWPDIAWFAERPLRKIHVCDGDGVVIPDLLARDLTENNIAPTGSGKWARAGRRFTGGRSEKGNGTTTILPFTGLSKPQSPQAGANLSGARVRLQGRCPEWSSGAGT